MKKRVKGKKGDKAAKAFVTETVPCDSFFNMFDPPEIPTDPNDLGDTEMDELQVWACESVGCTAVLGWSSCRCGGVKTWDALSKMRAHTSSA